MSVRLRFRATSIRVRTVVFVFCTAPSIAHSFELSAPWCDFSFNHPEDPTYTNVDNSTTYAVALYDSSSYSMTISCQRNTLNMMPTEQQLCDRIRWSTSLSSESNQLVECLFAQAPQYVRAIAVD